MSVEVEYVTHTCPVDGCAWSVATPRTSAFATFSAVMVAAELLAHMTSRRIDLDTAGYPQERLHSVTQIEELGLVRVLEAAGLKSDVAPHRYQAIGPSQPFTCRICGEDHE